MDPPDLRGPPTPTSRPTRRCRGAAAHRSRFPKRHPWRARSRRLSARSILRRPAEQLGAANDRDDDHRDRAARLPRRAGFDRVILFIHLRGQLQGSRNARGDGPARRCGDAGPDPHQGRFEHLRRRDPARPESATAVLGHLAARSAHRQGVLRRRWGASPGTCPPPARHACGTRCPVVVFAAGTTQYDDRPRLVQHARAKPRAPLVQNAFCSKRKSSARPDLPKQAP